MLRQNSKATAKTSLCVIQLCVPLPQCQTASALSKKHFESLFYWNYSLPEPGTRKCLFVQQFARETMLLQSTAPVYAKGTLLQTILS